jgi:hypothetical protein
MQKQINAARAFRSLFADALDIKFHRDQEVATAGMNLIKTELKDCILQKWRCLESDSTVAGMLVGTLIERNLTAHEKKMLDSATSLYLKMEETLNKLHDSLQ